MIILKACRESAQLGDIEMLAVALYLRFIPSIASVSGVTFIVGVDGGASKIVALIATESGRIVGRGQAGSSNYQNVGSASANEAIRAAVHDALNKAHLTRKELAIAVVSLARIKKECRAAVISILKTEPVRGALMIALCKVDQRELSRGDKLTNLDNVLHRT